MRLVKVSWILAMAIVLATAGSGAASAEDSEPEHDELVNRMDVLLDVGMVFRADITETRPLKADNWKGRHLNIRCIEGCSSRVAYHEDSFDAPLAVFRLGDGDDQIITLWTGATGYYVRIYLLSKSGIKKIFDRYTRAGPDFATTVGWGRLITLYQHDEERGIQPDNTWAMISEKFLWNGTAYVRAPKKIKTW